MSDTLAAIEDYTRLTILRLRGELAVDDRPRLDALEEQLRDQIDGARPAPRKIENPSAAPSRPTMNVKPAQVTVTRRGPGEEAAAAAPSIAPAPPASMRAAPSRPASVAPTPAASAPPPAAPPRTAPPAAAPRPEPPRVRSEPAPTLSTLDKSKLNEIPARAVGRTAYTPSVSPLFMDDYYESTLAPDHSLSGHDKATRVLALGEETMALPEEARVLFGVSDAPVIRAATPADPLRTTDAEEGELTELRGDGEETEAREPVFAGRSLPRDNSQTAIAPPPPARPTPAPPRVSGTAPARPSAVAPPVAPPPSRPAPASPPAAAARSVAPTVSAPPQAPRTRPPEARPITPIIVQLLSGETKRGELVAFEPDAGVVTLRATPQAAEESVDVNEVFAVFVGHARGVPPRPAEGTRIAVRMTNDREVVGVSPDYAPGANSMTLVPDDRRTVDRIWIPAWSVTEIRFA
jgi:hypothetical protein